MKVFVSSFGCRVNQYEGERVREGFIRGGAEFIPDYEKADVCVVNTCSVTDNADADARLLLRRIRRANPSTRLVITGCYADRAPGELQELFPEALIVSNKDKNSIPSLSGCSMGLGDSQDNAISAFRGHTRAYIKVQDGCNMRCTYCIIPSTRSQMDSRPVDEILDEISGLIASGYREFVLCGIRLGRYWAKDCSFPNGKWPMGNGQLDRWVDLIGLIERLASLDGDFRIRLSSIEISDLTDRFLQAYVEIPKTVPYFHIPIQSGSDQVLSAMKRWYGTQFYRQRLSAVRRIVGEDAAIFTDYMVGFPSETNEQFEESWRFAQEMDFAGMHIFRYSPREGTPAAGINPVYTLGEVEERLKKVRELDALWRRQYASRFEGRPMQVLRESRKEQVWSGHSLNFLKTKLPINIEAGWQTVKIARAEGEVLIAHGL